jgi:acetyl-CoA carboxylase biotin carboxyl carrier protein
LELNPETIKALLDAFDRSDWREMTVTIGANRLHISRDPSADGAAPQMPAAAPPEPPSLPAPAPEPAGEPPAPAQISAPDPVVGAASGTAVEAPSGTAVESPSVGLFWRAPSPGAPPFVEVGDRVNPGDTVAIVEVMKLMNHVVATHEGVVTAILVENGAAVEFGQALVVIDSEG